MAFVSGTARAAVHEGVIMGTVTSDKNEVIEGASVVVFNLDTGEATETKTDGKGGYRLGGLAKGDYELSAFKAGYDLYQSGEIKVSPDKPVRHDIKLERFQQATDLN